MRFHISFNWKTIKKFLIPLGLAIAVYFGFNSMTVYAIEDGSSTTYINGIQFFINGTETRTTEFKTVGAGDVKMSVDGAFVLGTGDTIPTYIYQRITLCMDEYTSAGWNNVNNFEVYAQHTSITCGYYGSSAKGHVVFITSKVDTDTDIAPGRLYNSLYLNVYNTASIGLLGLEFATQPFPIYYENDTLIKQNDSIIDKLEESIEANGNVSYKIDETNEKLNETNQKLDETNQNLSDLKEQQKETHDFLTDDTAPESDISSLGNVQGLLPPGPVDSLLNIPFQFLSVINSSFGGVCVPYTGDFVFDSTLTLPCFSEMFYDEVPPLLLNFLSLIPASFILMQYFKHLYKKVNRAVSMETSADDEWGVL